MSDVAMKFNTCLKSISNVDNDALKKPWSNELENTAVVSVDLNRLAQFFWMRTRRNTTTLYTPGNQHERKNKCLLIPLVTTGLYWNRLCAGVIFSRWGSQTHPLNGLGNTGALRWIDGQRSAMGDSAKRRANTLHCLSAVCWHTRSKKQSLAWGFLLTGSAWNGFSCKGII